MSGYDNIAAARIIIRILKFFGLWRLQQPHRQLYYVLYARLLHFSCTFAYTLMMWIDVIQAGDLEKFTYIMYMSLTELALVVKVVNMWRYVHLALEFFSVASTDNAFRLRTTTERRFWTEAAQRYRFVAFMYFFMSLTLVTLAFVSVLFSAQYELPFPYAPPFEWRLPRNYWFAYGYELVAMPVTCLSNCALDMIICYMLLHVSLCYRLAGMRLERLGSTSYDTDDFEVLTTSAWETQKYYEEHTFARELRQNFVLHQKIKRLAKQCESIVSIPFLIQILCSAFVLCFSAYRLQKVRILEHPSQFFILMLAVAVMTLQIFVPCFCGNEIIVQSNALTNAIYSSSWLQRTSSTRRYVFIYMEFLKQPMRIRAGNFFDIGLPVFSKTMNNAYSLMALLLNMNK